MTWNDLDTIKLKAPNNSLKVDNPPNFQIQVAKGQLEKSQSTATLKFEYGDIFCWKFRRNDEINRANN